MISATASIGMLMQWNVETGLQAIDKYMYADDPQIKVCFSSQCYHIATRLIERIIRQELH